MIAGRFKLAIYRNRLRRWKPLRARARGSSAKTRNCLGHESHARTGDHHGETRLSRSAMTLLTCWQVRNPSMPVFDIDGLSGRRKRRIREGAYGDPHHFGFTNDDGRVAILDMAGQGVNCRWWD